MRELGTPTHIGENGQGLVLKLAINISLAVQMLAFAEGLLLAERSGVDRQRALDVMETSPIGSPMLRARASIILDPPEDAWFDLSFMHKGHRAGARRCAPARHPAADRRTCRGGARAGTSARLRAARPRRAVSGAEQMANGDRGRR
jgi:3-hydroxyisobutyrate dehydrogenase-like beta-hydroxyacid dehydrogenase